ncbi:hypothetical protein AVEN_110532-1 [Araneus ventricosus]|uniref:Uncharacterized protein n=1 Tax=Araneus ventricosus TaxID=182803 RepID=A0A4Y2N795_ARAVE|nr:hypothetical protein AVEN_110532-1 [Araneus ventricosus]
MERETRGKSKNITGGNRKRAERVKTSLVRETGKPCGKYKTSLVKRGNAKHQSAWKRGRAGNEEKTSLVENGKRGNIKYRLMGKWKNTWERNIITGTGNV